MNILLFIKRIRHCAGFGVQSPTDYAFVRDVIYERLPYHAYQDLELGFPTYSKTEHWQARLLLRIANHAQAKSIVYCRDNIPALYYTAMHFGCTKTDIIACGNKKDACMHAENNGTWLVIPEIYGKNKNMWDGICALDHIVAFDLYYLGIAFVDKKRYSETHIINPY